MVILEYISFFFFFLLSKVEAPQLHHFTPEILIPFWSRTPAVILFFSIGVLMIVIVVISFLKLENKGQSNRTVRRTFAQHTVNLGSIPGISDSPRTPPRVIPEFRGRTSPWALLESPKTKQNNTWEHVGSKCQYKCPFGAWLVLSDLFWFQIL